MRVQPSRARRPTSASGWLGRRLGAAERSRAWYPVQNSDVHLQRRIRDTVLTAGGSDTRILLPGHRTRPPGAHGRRWPHTVPWP